MKKKKTVDAIWSPDEATDLAVSLGVLSLDMRLQILAHLATRPEATVTEIQAHLGQFREVNQSGVSHHLAILAAAGWVRHERRARHVYYRSVPEKWIAVTGQLNKGVEAVDQLAASVSRSA